MIYYSCLMSVGVALEHSWPQSSELLLEGSWALAVSEEKPGPSDTVATPVPNLLDRGPLLTLSLTPGQKLSCWK